MSDTGERGPTDGIRDIDVLIIGAGVNGAGLFRDLCAQGVDCIIIDKGDYCSGTSAAPSRLIHGGLKYLETGEFGLVAQSTLERNLLLRNAPHLVSPLPTIIPIFSWTKGVGAAVRTLFGATRAPRSRGALLIKIGLALYDFYGARSRVMPRHHMTSRSRALKDIPALTPRIVATGHYYDARITHPERLVLELLVDGVAANPRSAHGNHARFDHRGDGVIEIESPKLGRMTVRPRIAINAAGPWIDTVNAALGVPSRLIGGTKGSHILMRHDALVKALDGNMIYFEADDGRICLVYAYLGLALVGSTDIKAANPDTVRCEDEEIAYFLASLAALLPGLQFRREDIVYAYSGIRPLPAMDAAEPGLISRDHSAPVAEPSGKRPFPIISLVGGKWTTFRGFAEEVADLVLKRLGRPRIIGTRDMPIGGGRDFPLDAQASSDWLAATARESGASEERLALLLDRYGTTARAVPAHEAAMTGGAEPIEGCSSYTVGEIDYLCRHEDVVHLADIVLRRTTLAITGAISMAGIAEIAGIAGAALGWTGERRADEIAELTAELRDIHHMTMLHTPAAQSPIPS